MAKLPTLWLQGASQRMAGAVVYQQAGRTLGRSLAQSISNPRTASQMSQRIKLANLVKLYQVNRSWAKLSFETKPRTWSDYNAFVSANLAGAVVYLTKPQVAAGAAVVAPVKVTAGTLGNITLRASEGGILSNINITAGAIGSSVTIARFTEGIISSNNGIQEGDQFSFIQYIQQTDPQGFPFIICRPYEVILNRTDNRPLSDFLPTDILLDAGEVETVIFVDTSEFTGGVAMVLSRTTASSTRVTTGYICLTPDNTVYPQFTSPAAAEAARQSYGQGEDVFLDSRDAGDKTGNHDVSLAMISMKINDVITPQNREVSIPIASGTKLQFNFSNYIPTTAASYTLLAGTSPEAMSTVNSTNVIADGNVVQMTTAVPIGSSSWTTGSNFYLGVRLEGVVYTWKLKVASNSMD